MKKLALLLMALLPLLATGQVGKDDADCHNRLLLIFGHRSQLL